MMSKKAKYIHMHRSIIMIKDIRLLGAAHIFYIIIVELVVMNLDMFNV